MRFFWLALLIVLLPLRAWTGGPLSAGMHKQASLAQAAHGKPAMRHAPEVAQAHQAHQADQDARAGRGHHDHEGHHAHAANEAHEAHPAGSASSVDSAAADCPGHDGDNAAHSAGHAGGCGPGHACQLCADCSACHTLALAQSVAGFKPVQPSPALPQAPRVQFTSADAAPGHKPPIT